MQMRIASLSSLVLVASIAFGANKDSTEEANRPPRRGDISAQDIRNIQACRQACLTALKEASDTRQSISDALASNDQDKMKAALERADKVFADAQNTHEQCMLLRMQSGAGPGGRRMGPGMRGRGLGPPSGSSTQPQ